MSFSLLNMLINIKNGQKARKSYILQKKTANQLCLLNELWKEGFILGYKIINTSKNQSFVKIFLKYYSSTTLPAINYIKIVSKPGKKVYCSVKTLWKLNSYVGVFYFSTNLGILNLIECKKHNVGGELLCLVK